jgi:LacI family transcriptional regulator, galactose operon repressor
MANASSRADDELMKVGWPTVDVRRASALAPDALTDCGPAGRNRVTPSKAANRVRLWPATCSRLLMAHLTDDTAKITLSGQTCQDWIWTLDSTGARRRHPGHSLSDDLTKLKRRPTMVDVAALAGVGLKTVSRVVNAEPGVSPQLQARVRQAIEQLNYRRDANASMLRRLGGKTQTIGLVLEDVANPFSSALHRAVEDAARERGVLLFAGSCDEDPVRERELIGSFRDRRVDGIIVVPAGHDHSYLYEERRSGTALVFVDRPAAHLDADSIISDNAGGAFQAVNHLLARGHRRIAFLGDLLSISTASERLSGYRQALASAGVTFDQQLVRAGLRDPEAAAAAATEMLTLPERPTAIFTGQNLLTIGGLRALHRMGVEDEIALVGFDDISLADMVEPAVSVVAQDPQAIGRAATEILFRRLDGDRSPAVHHVIPVNLIARGSGEIAPGGNA